MKVDKILLAELVDNRLTNVQIAKILGVSRSTVVREKARYGLKSKYFEEKENKPCVCCGIFFECAKSEGRKFCSQSCSASFNNQKRYEGKLIKLNLKYNDNLDILKGCQYCKKEFKICKRSTKKIRKFCSNKCQRDFEANLRYEILESGGLVSHKVAKSYLIKKYGDKCMQCGWNEKNVVTGRCPIDLEHIDGNSENNNLDNLKLLCPNCHSLTETYKALNVGKGRHKRMERYRSGKSF
jgi:predicted transcriptional regulator